MGLRHLLRMGGGLLLASTLSVGLVALPAGAAVKEGATKAPVATGATSSFTTEIASLQGHTVTLRDGSTCVVSAATCTVATPSATSALTSGTVLSLGLAPMGIERAHITMFLFGLYAFGGGGLAESIMAIAWGIFLF